MNFVPARIIVTCTNIRMQSITQTHSKTASVARARCNCTINTRRLLAVKMPKSGGGKQGSEESAVGEILSDLEMPTTSEVVFKHTWCIKKYNRTISKRDTVDSPEFRCAVNGFSSSWNISVRFWRGANGKKVKNPIVVCLSLTGCQTEEPGQGKVRFQFGVWDALIKHWECCPVSRVALNLETTKDMLSIGYRDLSILQRHIGTDGSVHIMVKLQVIQNEEERHCLSQDLGRALAHSENTSFNDTHVESMANEKDKECFKAHSLIIRARSPVLAKMLKLKSPQDDNNLKFELDLSELPSDLVTELLRYLYTDKVENLETNANRLLPIATRYSLPGLAALCERTLLDSLTPANVANILLLADQCKCDLLRKAALNYCEESTEIKENVHIGKTLAWRVMELVNPELFLEACESLGSSSSNLDSAGSHSDDQL